MTVEENVRLAKEYIKTYNEHDVDRFVTFWMNEDEGLARQEYQKNFWLVAFPDTHMEIISITAQDNRVVVEATVRATHTGPLRMWVTEPVSATNKKIEFAYCSIGYWENGKLRELRQYVDTASIVSQLGVSDHFDWKE